MKVGIGHITEQDAAHSGQKAAHLDNDCGSPLMRIILKSRSFNHRWRCLSGLLPAVLLLTRSSQAEAQTDTLVPSALHSITWQLTLIVFLTGISVVLSLFLAVYAWQRRNKPGVLAFAWFMTAIAECSIASALSMLSQTEETALFWANWIFLGTSTIPVLFLVFILQYSGRERWLSRRRIGMLFFIPLLTQVVVWTNDMHGLFIRQAQLAREGGLMLVQTKRLGPWFGVQTGYTHLLIVMGIICIVLMIIRPFHLYRKQAIGLLIGIIPPILNGLLITFDLIPALQNQLTSPSLTFMGGVFAWILFHHRFLDVVPVARDTLIDSMSDGMLVLDIQDRIVDLNPAVQSLLGPSSSQCIGQSAFDVLQSWQDLEEHLHQDPPIQAEIELDRHKMHHYYHLRISPLIDKRGQQAGKLIMLRDITEYKRVEASLRTSEQRFRELFSDSPDAIFVEDTQGTVLDANPAACQLHGMTRDELIGKHVLDLVPPDQRSQVAREFPAISRGEKAQTEGFSLTKDGRAVPVEIRISTIHFNGNPAVLLHVRDITERRQTEMELSRHREHLEELVNERTRELQQEITERQRAEQQLTLSLQEKNILLKEIHHRVKNNLQVISSLLNLQASLLTDEYSCSLFRESQQRVRTMALIHEKLYQSESLQEIDFQEYIRSLTSELYASYQPLSEPVEVVVDVADIHLDLDTAIPCGLVLTELLSNAFKYGVPSKNSRILVTFSAIADHHYELRISDNGVGLPPDIDLDTLDSLGLQLVKGLVEEQLNGTLELWRSPGTTWSIRFRK